MYKRKVVQVVISCTSTMAPLSTLLTILLSLLLASTSTSDSKPITWEVYYCTIGFYLDEYFIREIGYGSKAVAINLVKSMMESTNKIFYDTILANGKIKITVIV